MIWSLKLAKNKNCFSCKNEFQTDEHGFHKLCKVCWTDDPLKEETKKWILFKDRIINEAGIVDPKADNCPGYSPK